MSSLNVMKQRRSYYAINKDVPVSRAEILDVIRQCTVLTPDAFNMKSARVVVVLGEQQERLWDVIYDAFGGKVAREKTDGFKAGYGTVLYYIDTVTVQTMQEQFPRYAENFTGWSRQANGMLQFNVWSNLRGLGIGASLQHYNPVIDEAVAELLEIPESWELIAQMPFGGIAAEPDPKPAEDPSARVSVKE